MTTTIERPLIGVAMVCLGVMGFASADVFTKLLVTSLPVPFIMAVRYVVSVAVFLVLIGPKRRVGVLRANRPMLVIGRGIILTLGSLTMGIALQTIPVGEATAIIYLSPIAVMILAIPVLGERVTALGWLGAALGFLGVLLIIRPSGGLDSFGVAMALINAVCATLYHLSTRYLAKIERPATLMIYTLLVGAVTFTLLAFDDLFKYAPTLQEWAMMAGLGVAATLGHFLITLSYREAPASLLAPVNYVHILFSALAAWIVFDHAPDVLTSIGMLCIAVAGAGIALYSHFTKLASRA